jgi:hypothetical protein
MIIFSNQIDRVRSLSENCIVLQRAKLAYRNGLALENAGLVNCRIWLQGQPPKSTSSVGREEEPEFEVSHE